MHPVSSSTGSYATSNTQRTQNLELTNLGKALRAGDLSGAQSAFQNYEKNFSTGSSASNATLSSDVKSIQSALQSGDISGAQQAFKKLTTDLRTPHPTHGSHHRHVANATTVSSTTSLSDSTVISTSNSESATSSDPIASLVSFLSQSIGAMVNQQA
jgi:hypothetical protein